MSLVDFTASLFRDQQLAAAFNDNPVRALRDAGLPDVTPADVQALLPTVAESMPPDHPLQSLVRPAETSPVVEPQPVDPDVPHYYQLQPGDQVIDGVAGQTILRPDGTNVTLDSNDYILQPDEKVYLMQPGDQAIPGINGMVVQHPDGSVTDVGIDTTIVHEDEGYDVGGSDPRVTTTAEDLGGSDTGWTPYEEAMDWNIQPAVLPTTSEEQAIETLPEPPIDDPNLVICPPEEPEFSYEESDSYAADQSSYESTSATETSAGSEYIG